MSYFLALSGVISRFFIHVFQLLKRLNHRGRLHAVPASLKGKYVIRFTVTSTHTTNDDIIKDWSEIRSVASDILEECNAKLDKRVPLKGEIEILTISFCKFIIFFHDSAAR